MNYAYLKGHPGNLYAYSDNLGLLWHAAVFPTQKNARNNCLRSNSHLPALRWDKSFDFFNSIF